MSWELLHGDALEILAGLEPASFDAIVADPPYSSGGAMRSDREAPPAAKYRGWSQNADGSSRPPSSSYASFSGDSRDQRGWLAWCVLWLSRCYEVTKPGGVLFMCSDWRQLPTATDAIQAAGWVWRGVVVWDKGIGRPMKGRFRNHVEYVLWATKGPFPARADVYPSSVIRATPPAAGARLHLTEKPVELFAELLSIVGSGAILDPFAGSGAAGVAAVRAGFDYLGLEREADFCAIARRRLEETSAAAALF